MPLVLALIVGCGGGSEIPVVPVTGQVMLNGQPVEGASVAFIPQSPDGRAAAATTDSDGRYELQTAGADSPGAVPGAYQVTVSKFEVKTVRTPEQALAEVQKGSSLLAPPTEESSNVLPAKYLDPGRSGFSATVSETDENVFDFALEGK